MTSTWSEHELQIIEAEHEAVLASRRPDGSLGSPATIWVVRVGDEVFVRSAFGPGNRWYARARSAGSGHVTIGGVAREVLIEDASDDSPRPADQAALDREYHAKYDGRYPREYVDPVVDATSHGATLRLIPA